MSWDVTFILQSRKVDKHLIVGGCSKKNKQYMTHGYDKCKVKPKSLNMFINQILIPNIEKLASTM